MTCATRQDVPVLLQPPLLTTSANTACAGFFGAKTHNSTTKIVNPPMCPNNDIVSTIGSTGAPQVFKPMVKTRHASIIRVYCQLGKAKLEFVRLIMFSIRVATTKRLLATLASHARVDIQPAGDQPCVKKVDPERRSDRLRS